LNYEAESNFQTFSVFVCTNVLVFLYIHCVSKSDGNFYFLNNLSKMCPQCFDAPGWAAGRASGLGAGVVICLDRGADLHIAQLMPLPLTISCFSKIQIGFNFLVLAHPGSPGQKAVKWVCE